MLPEHYCDFLIALYTEGEALEDTRKKSASLKGIERFQIILLFLILPFSFVVIYFTEIETFLQLIILLLLLSYSVWVCFYFKGARSFYFHAALVISLFLLLLTSITAAEAWFYHPSATASVIVLNFLIWTGIGSYFRFNYLFYIGLLGTGFVIIYHFL